MAAPDWRLTPDTPYKALFEELIAWVEDQLDGTAVRAVGHRVVHGGDVYREPVLVDADVLRTLEGFVSLAPLHQPHNLAPIRELATMKPGLPQVACFDTAFHAGHEPAARNFALPRELTAEGIHRYGFHGLSYEFIARRLPDVDPESARGRAVVAHLGSGASMCAIHRGRSVASTMGFTAVDGLPMGTRTGSLDPGVLLYLLQERGMDARGLQTLLYRESGLLGVSGISNDMRILLASDDPNAREAIDLFVYRIHRELGSLAAALGGLEALVFTAGIGENAPEIRARVCEAARWLGVVIDPDANRRNARRLHRPESAVRVWVIPTNEELMIAQHTRRLVF
jgi:acetate kinase